jgi:hypothetical protein
VGAARRLQHRGRVGGWHVKVTDVLASGAELVGNAELGGGAQRVDGGRHEWCWCRGQVAGTVAVA